MATRTSQSLNSHHHLLFAWPFCGKKCAFKMAGWWSSGCLVTRKEYECLAWSLGCPLSRCLKRPQTYLLAHIDMDTKGTEWCTTIMLSYSSTFANGINVLAGQLGYGEWYWWPQCGVPWAIWETHVWQYLQAFTVYICLGTPAPTCSATCLHIYACSWNKLY